MTSQPASPLSDTARTSLNLIFTAVDTLTDLPGQDRTMVIEMSQRMLAKLLDDGTVGDMRAYIHRYGRFDSGEEADAIADRITSSAETAA